MEAQAAILLALLTLGVFFLSLLIQICGRLIAATPLGAAIARKLPQAREEPMPPAPAQGRSKVAPEWEAFWERAKSMPPLAKNWWDTLASRINDPGPLGLFPVIERKREEIISGSWAPEVDPEAARRLAMGLDAMFLCWDWGAAFLLRPDGSILCAPDGEYDKPVAEADPAWRLAALARACAVHPELRPMLPARPANAIDCAACEGTGAIQFSEGRPVSCLICSRLCWVVPAEDPAS